VGSVVYGPVLIVLLLCGYIIGVALTWNIWQRTTGWGNMVLKLKSFIIGQNSIKNTNNDAQSEYV